MKLSSLIALLFLLLTAPSLDAATYYLSAKGNDAHDGKSPEKAWASLERVNATRFLAGDSILLEGGSTFSGSIFFGQEVCGAAGQPIVISSYGEGRAVISSGDSFGIKVYNSAGFKISRLVFRGSGRTTNTTAGLDFYMDLPETRLTYLHIDSVEVLGYRRSGIQIGSWMGSSGYDEVSITGCEVHDNGEAGISTYAEAILGHKNFYVGYSKAYNNSGLPEQTDHHSGSGIVLGGVDGALIEYCEAYNNGWLNAWKGGGPVGIWGYHCNNLIIQYNESHHNKSGTAKDGGGFDIDGGCTNCTIQYNYSHDNYGPGYLIAQYVNAPPMKSVVVRYNISENDARNASYGAIHLWSSGSNGGIQEAEIYNNTIYLSPSAHGKPKAIYVQSGGVRKGNFRNNILQTSGVQDLIYVDKSTDVRFEGNTYWTGGGTGRFYWAGTAYTSLDQWRVASSQETLSGAPTGYFQDPQLKEPGSGGTIGDPRMLYTLSAYELKTGAALAGKALDLQKLFGIEVGKNDLWGNSLEQPNDLCPGAHQLTAGSKVCLDGGIVALAPVSSLTGTFSGVGVVDKHYFDPSLSGEGVHKLQFSYTDSQGQLKSQPYTLRVIAAGVTEWKGMQTKSEDWFDSQNWTACVPTASIDALVSVPQDPVLQAREGAVPNINGARSAQVKNLSTPDTLSFKGDGILEINGIYSGKGMESEHHATVVFKSQEGQAVPAGDYGKLVLQGTGSSRIASHVRVSRELDLGQGLLYLGNHNLHLGKEGEIINASSTSYVVTDGDGALVREGLGNGRWAVFPLGTAESYTPAYLLNSGEEDDFSLQLTPGVREAGTSSIYYENAHVNRTWHVEERVKGGSQVQLKLQWNAADEQPDLFWDESYISHYENGEWSKPDENAAYAEEIGAGIYQLSLHNIRSFSPFAVKDRSVVLPVTFRMFNVIAEGDAAYLRWETTEEKGNEGFWVEVSGDGSRYRRLGFVSSKAADSHELQQYSYRDTENDKQGIRYYRLRQQDMDGSITYSPVETIYFGQLKASLSAHPNPFRGEVTLNISSVVDGELSLQFTDLYGRAVYSNTAQIQAGQNSLSLSPGHHLPAGIYLLTVSFGGKHHQLRLVKQ